MLILELFDLHVKNNKITSFNSFGVAHIPKMIEKLLEKLVILNKFRIQELD